LARVQKPIPLKGNMSRLIPQNQLAHRRQWPIGRIFSQHSIIRGADELGERKHLQFKPDPKGLPAKAKGCKTPMGRNHPALKSLHGAAQQSSVLRLLGKPQVHYLPHLVRATAKVFTVKRN
jgi:hypothetical protein